MGCDKDIVLGCRECRVFCSNYRYCHLDSRALVEGSNKMLLKVGSKFQTVSEL